MGRILDFFKRKPSKIYHQPLAVFPCTVLNILWHEPRVLLAVNVRLVTLLTAGATLLELWPWINLGSLDWFHLHSGDSLWATVKVADETFDLGAVHVIFVEFHIACQLLEFNLSYPRDSSFQNNFFLQQIVIRLIRSRSEISLCNRTSNTAQAYLCLIANSWSWSSLIPRTLEVWSSQI